MFEFLSRRTVIWERCRNSRNERKTEVYKAKKVCTLPTILEEEASEARNEFEDLVSGIFHGIAALKLDDSEPMEDVKFSKTFGRDTFATPLLRQRLHVRSPVEGQCFGNPLRCPLQASRKRILKIMREEERCTQESSICHPNPFKKRRLF